MGDHICTGDACLVEDCFEVFAHFRIGHIRVMETLAMIALVY
jgi:hypothetical protein